MKIIITGKQIDDQNNIIDKIELSTNAKITIKDNQLIYDYEETAVDNTDDIIKTRLRVYPERVVMTKISSLSSTLEFEKNKTYYSVYSTIYGDLQMEIYTMEYENNLDETGQGEITLKYKITIGNKTSYINILNVKTIA